MKVNQKSIIRWVAKLVAKEPSNVQRKAGTELRVLSADQLRQVSGGTGATTDLPNKGW
jgi:hypothetical protein